MPVSLFPYKGTENNRHNRTKKHIYLFDNQHLINLPAKQYDHIAPTDRKHLSPAFTEDRHELVTFFETLLIKAARTAVITVKAYRLTVLRHHDV